MTPRLPIPHAVPSAMAMRARAFTILLLIAMLFAAFGATPDRAVPSHGNELFAASDHADAPGHEERHDPAGDAPCQTASHHHCSIALTVEAPALSPALALRKPGVRPLAAPAMASHAQAPPTLPPSA